MRILVTGANGYLGQGIVKCLVDKGHIVIAADFKTENVDPRAEKIECNLFEIEKPYDFFGAAGCSASLSVAGWVCTLFVCTY